MSKINVKNILETVINHLANEFSNEMKVNIQVAIHATISKFVKHIDKIIGECQNYQQYFEELKMMKEFYEEKLK